MNAWYVKAVVVDVFDPSDDTRNMTGISEYMVSATDMAQAERAVRTYLSRDVTNEYLECLLEIKRIDAEVLMGNGFAVPSSESW